MLRLFFELHLSASPKVKPPPSRLIMPPRFWVNPVAAAIEVLVDPAETDLFGAVIHERRLDLVTERNTLNYLNHR